MSTIISQLASSIGRRDEVPNQELAQRIAKSYDQGAVKELVSLLSDKNKAIQSDSIKVLDETAKLKPALVASYAKDLIALLDSKNNRLQWGTMAVIDAITPENPKLIYAALPKLVAVAGKGSVITKDHLVNILIHLCAVKAYAVDAFALLIEQLLKSPTNQLPMYAERALPIINDQNKKAFVKVLTSRLDEIEKDTKRKRVEKVIKKLSKDA